MTLKSYLLIMSTLTAACWGIFVFVGSLVDPAGTNWIGFLLFYVTLFVALSGTIFLIGFVIRFIALKRELAFNLVKTAFRQSFLLALFIIILLLIKSQNLLTWLNISLLIITFTVTELFLMSTKKSR